VQRTEVNGCEQFTRFTSGAVSERSALSACRSGDDSKTYLIEYSERYLSQGDAVVNGYREGQDVCCAPLSA
jgi:hypothetical protein